jgi:hypothetical protein
MLNGQYLKEIAIRPQCFNHLGHGHRWYALYSSNTLTGYAAIGSVTIDKATVHFEWVRFGPKAYKDAFSAFHFDLVPELRRLGYKSLIATKEYNGKATEPWAKFITRLGWPEPKVVLASEMEL